VEHDSLISPAAFPELPAPFWLLTSLRGLGFVLHMVPMHLWFAGLLCAVVMQTFGGERARYLSARLLRQMPIIVALGVNFGIVPLLFLQVTHGQVFYAATTLMAIPWLAIIPLVIIAYALVYVCAFRLRGTDRLRGLPLAAGWIASVLFIVVGFLFAGGMSLLSSVGSWLPLWEEKQVAGATLGNMVNHGQSFMSTRWGMMFGLALVTTAAYLVFDAAILAARASDEHRRFTARTALVLATMGVLVFAVTGSAYVFHTWDEDVRAQMFSGSLLPLTLATAAAPGATWLLIAAQRRGASRSLALATTAAQVAVLAVNTVSRMVHQHIQLKPHFDAAAKPVDTQWSPLLTFLVLFVAGLVVIAWMIARAFREVRASAAS
jgi:cytochrome bd-type quinol oxidase subunit 2